METSILRLLLTLKGRTHILDLEWIKCSWVSTMAQHLKTAVIKASLLFFQHLRKKLHFTLKRLQMNVHKQQTRMWSRTLHAGMCLEYISTWLLCMRLFPAALPWLSVFLTSDLLSFWHIYEWESSEAGPGNSRGKYIIIQI